MIGTRLNSLTKPERRNCTCRTGKLSTEFRDTRLNVITMFWLRPAMRRNDLGDRGQARLKLGGIYFEGNTHVGVQFAALEARALAEI